MKAIALLLLAQLHTNVLLRSEELENPAWLSSGVTDVKGGPLGRASAITGFACQTMWLHPGRHTFSLYASGPAPQLEVFDAQRWLVSPWEGAPIIDTNLRWQRYAVPFKAMTDGLYEVCVSAPSNAHVEVFGLQVERGTTPRSYLRTRGAMVAGGCDGFGHCFCVSPSPLGCD